MAREYVSVIQNRYLKRLSSPRITLRYSTSEARLENMTGQEKNLTLKEALKKKKLKQFIKQHDKQTGDKEAFDSILSSMASGKSPKARQPSAPDDSEN